MRISGSSPLGRRSTHTPRHLPNPRTAGRGVTQRGYTITYHYPSGRTVSHFSHSAWAYRRAKAVAAHKRARAAAQAKRHPSGGILDSLANYAKAHHIASQAIAISKGAPNVFSSPIGSDTLARRAARQVQHTDVLRAKQPGYPRLPYFPTFNRPYTPKERNVIQSETLRVARKQHVTGKQLPHVIRSRPERGRPITRAASQAAEAYQAQDYRRLIAAHSLGTTTGAIAAGPHMLTKGQREGLRKLAPVLSELRSGKSIPISAQAAASRHYHYVTDPRRSQLKPARKVGTLDRLTGNIADELGRRWQPAGFLRAPFETARAAVEHPGSIPHTLKDLALLPIAAPAGIVETVLHPERTAKGFVADLNRRYGPLDPSHSNAAAFRQRIAKEGFAPELLDVAGVGGTGAALLGRGLGQTARAGSFGTRLQRFAKETRPGLRVSGGVVRSQELSPNLFRAGLQRAEDRLRTRRVARRHPDEHGRVRGLQPQTRAVSPSGRPAEVVPLFEKRAQRIAVSKIQSRHFLRFSSETGREVQRGAMREMAKLSHPQRQAVFHALQGLVPLHSAAEAVKHLKERRRAIVTAYRATGRKGLPREVKTIDFLVKHADEVFTSKLRDFHAGELARGERIGHTGVNDWTAEARRFRPQAHHLGIPYDYAVMEREIRQQATRDMARARTKVEAAHVAAARDVALQDLAHRKPQLDQAFVEKVRAEAQKHGLPEPVYVQHFSLLQQAESRAPKAVGGRRAAPRPNQSHLEEALFAQGRADTRPLAYIQSLHAAIKRKHNWTSVAAQAEAHSFPNPSRAELQNVFGHQHVDPEHLTAHEWQQVLEHRGLDPRDYALWNPGRFRSRLVDPISGPSADRLSEHAVQHALDEGFVRVDRASETTPGAGFKLIPREVYNEIHSTVSSSNLAGRVLDKGQALQSRLLLGTNPAWEQVQIGANAFLSAIGTRGHLADFVRAPVFFHKLPPEVRQEVQELLGEGVGAGHGRQLHLGAAADGGLVNGYRAIRDSLKFKAASFRQGIPLLRKLPSGNPIELMFALDEAQNSYFKKVVLYNHIKRQAFRDMTAQGGVAMRLQGQITHLLSLGPKERMRAIIDNPQLLERHAQATLDVLGDYTRYTAKERATFKRYVLFYGFMRYSLRTLFYTMPVKHPIVMAAVGKLAQLHVDEVKGLLGGDEAPWAYSRIFFGPKGDLRSIDLARLNPVVNPLIGVSTEGVKSAGGFFSPVVQAALDQLYGKSLFTGRGFRVHGSATEAKSIDAITRARIFGKDIASTIYPYRVAQKLTQTGTQGDESLLGFPAPIHFKTPEAQAREAQKRRNAGSVTDALLHQLLPFIPQPDDSRAVAAAIRAAKKKSGTHGRGTGSPFSAPSGAGSPFPG